MLLYLLVMQQMQGLGWESITDTAHLHYAVSETDAVQLKVMTLTTCNWPN
jgi:hypothetical protein